jgi:hypothetical protein
MALFTRQTTSFESPDSTQGGTAVDVPANTGHDPTESIAATRTCRWLGIADGITGVKTSIVLSFDWTENGVFGGAPTSFRVQYSTNGGGAWTTIFDHTNVNAPNSGNAQVALPSVTNITQVQVRDRIFADISGGSSLSASVSNIKLTIRTQDPGVVFIS